MSNFVSGDNWWARVEEKGQSRNVTYWRVIAWEKLDSNESTDEPEMVAWINGRSPIRSDMFEERVYGDYVFTGFVDALPEGACTQAWN